MENSTLVKYNEFKGQFQGKGIIPAPWGKLLDFIASILGWMVALPFVASEDVKEVEAVLKSGVVLALAAAKAWVNEYPDIPLPNIVRVQEIFLWAQFESRSEQLDRISLRARQEWDRVYGQMYAARKVAKIWEDANGRIGREELKKLLDDYNLRWWVPFVHSSVAYLSDEEARSFEEWLYSLTKDPTKNVVKPHRPIATVTPKASATHVPHYPKFHATRGAAGTWETPSPRIMGDTPGDVIQRRLREARWASEAKYAHFIPETRQQTVKRALDLKEQVEIQAAEHHKKAAIEAAVVAWAGSIEALDEALMEWAS